MRTLPIELWHTSLATPTDGNRPLHKILIKYCLLVLGFAAYDFPAFAASYPHPQNGNFLVGEIQYVHTGAEDTLLDIARKYDLGFNEMIAANPEINPWLPGENTRVTVPTQFILPEPPWEGIIINLPEMRLYHFPEPKEGQPRMVTTHPIGVGRQGKDTPPGQYGVLLKIENPNWTIPQATYQDMLAEGYSGGRLVPAGPENPLGKFAMKLNDDGLYIHGTNKPYSIGMRVSNGCIRLYPEDIANLVAKVPKGTKVRVIEQPYKFGKQDGKLFFEAHLPIEKSAQVVANMTPLVSGLVKSSDDQQSKTIDWDYVFSSARGYTGIPTPVDNPGAGNSQFLR